MTTAIIGLGNMGKGIASRLAGKADIIVATRNDVLAREFAKSNKGVTAASIEEAIKVADVIFIAVPYSSALEIAAMPSLKGKIIVDISNPVKPDFSGLTLGHTTSAAEEIQAVAKGSIVVKAFNTIFASVFASSPAATTSVPVYLAGNDAAAVDAVAELVSLAGFAAEKTGALDAARLLEPLGMLNIRFGYGLGKGTSIAPNWTAIAA